MTEALSVKLQSKLDLEALRPQLIDAVAEKLAPQVLERLSFEALSESLAASLRAELEG